MNLLALIGSSFLLLFIVMIYLLRHTPTKSIQRSDYLRSMAHFFEGQLSAIPENENSFRIQFKYRGYECFYEDIELAGLRAETTSYLGYLKVKSSANLKLTFSEKVRTQIRSNAQSLDEVANSRWGTLQGQVRLPKELAEFHAYTNNPEWANQFFNDSKMLKVFVKYKNRDSRGHPVLSLQITDGVVALEFHSQGQSKPSLLELEHNVTCAETYLQELISIAKVLEGVDSKRNENR